MILELCANPNVHQPLGPGRELLREPDFALFFSPGSEVHAATVQRVRTTGTAVASVLARARELLRERGRSCAGWELGDGGEPHDLVERLLELGLERDADEPVAVGLALRGIPAWPPAAGIEVRRVSSLEELAEARAIQQRAFGGSELRQDEEQLALDLSREGVDGATFVACLDGAPVAAAYAAYTEWAVLLFGGGTLEHARGRGAYRALVMARAHEAERRGTPVLVTHAGKLSLPILEGLGFERVARIERLVDRF